MWRHVDSILLAISLCILNILTVDPAEAINSFDNCGALCSIPKCTLLIFFTSLIRKSALKSITLHLERFLTISDAQRPCGVGKDHIHLIWVSAAMLSSIHLASTSLKILTNIWLLLIYVAREPNQSSDFLNVSVSKKKSYDLISHVQDSVVPIIPALIIFHIPPLPFFLRA